MPPGLFAILAAIAALLVIKKRRRASAIVALVDALLIYVASTTAFSNLLLRPLEDTYPPLSDAKDASLIIVLGGGYIDMSPETGGSVNLGPESEKRAVYGLELAKKYKLPLVYSGGTAYDSVVESSEAEAAERLWASLGLEKDRISLETGSLDTKGNASGVAALVGTSTALLVTSAYHMPRAMYAFRKAGIRVIAAPTNYRAKRSALTLSDFLPAGWRLEDSRIALHEYLGILYYRMIL